MKDDEKKIIVNNRCFTPKLKKANKIRMELLSLTKDQMEKKETKFNRFSISKKEKKEINEKEKEKKEETEKENDEQSSNIIINSNNSDTDDSGIDSSDMSGCEEEEII